MSGEFGAVVGRRGRAEIERLASCMGRAGWDEVSRAAADDDLTPLSRHRAREPQESALSGNGQETGINPLQRLFIEYNPPGCFQCEGWSRVGLGKRSSLIQRFPAF